MQLQHGDVLVYNPEAVHGTTEFEFARPTDGCIMLAFFCSAQALEACVVKSVLPSVSVEWCVSDRVLSFDNKSFAWQ